MSVLFRELNNGQNIATAIEGGLFSGKGLSWRNLFPIFTVCQDFIPKLRLITDISKYFELVSIFQKYKVEVRDIETPAFLCMEILT